MSYVECRSYRYCLKKDFNNNHTTATRKPKIKIK